MRAVFAFLRRIRPAARVWLLGLLLAVLAGAWGYRQLPHWVQQRLEQTASAQLGRSVQLDALDWTLWALAVELRGLDVAHADGRKGQLHIERVQLALDPATFWRGVPLVRALAIQGPRLELQRRPDGHLDIDDVWARWSTSEPKAEPEPEPARWQLRQLSVQDGRIDWFDARTQSAHHLTALQLQLPLLSRLDNAREAWAEPVLSLTLDGAVLKAQARLQPFAPQPQAQAEVQLHELPLVRYAGDLAPWLPGTLQQGRLSLAAQLQLPLAQPQQLQLSGQLSLDDVRLVDRPGAELLRLQGLRLPVREARPLQQQWALGDVTLKGLRWRAAPAGAKAPKQEATPDGATARAASTVTGSSGAPAPVVPSAPARAATVSWRSLDIADLGLQPAPGTALRLDLAALHAGPLQFRNDARGDWHLDLGPLRVEAGRVQGDAATPALAWQTLALERVAYAAAARQLDLGKLQWRQPQLALQRDRQGRWMFEPWLAALQPAGPARPATPAAAAKAPQGDRPDLAPALRWSVAGVQLQGARLALSDQALAPTSTTPAVPGLELVVDALQLETGTLRSDAPLRFDAGGRLASWRSPGAAAAATAPAAAPGRWRIKGQADLRNKSLEADLSTQDLPLHDLSAYVPTGLPLHLAHGLLSAEARVRATAATEPPTVQGAGELGLHRLRVRADPVEGGGEADIPLRWERLLLHGVQVDSAPRQALRLQIQSSEVAGLYAVASLDPKGQLNWQRLLQSPTADAAASASPAAPASAPAAAAALKPVLAIGPTTLSQARLVFSDAFIQPPFTVDVSDIAASLGAFSTADADDPQAMAELQLHGLAQGHASLDVHGRLHPLARPLRLDVKGQLNGVDLPALSPYARKFAGYGIDQGSLNLAVHYRVSPTGELQADNQLMLGQLHFGERDSHSLADWPVKLASTLLADEQGVIQLDLPISGSLGNPDFQVGPIVYKLLGQLIWKAVTAPFSLLAHALGGGTAQSDSLPFEAGRTSLTPQGQAQLERLLLALRERPSLVLTLSGHASAVADQAIGLPQARQGAPALTPASAPATAAASTADLQRLADARGRAVKTWLQQQGLAADRLSLEPAVVDAADASEAQPRVQLKLHQP